MFTLACTVCAWQGEEGELNACPACGGTLDVRYASPAIPVDLAQPGLWRYVAHLPVESLFDSNMASR
jgi:hypothetical protein